METDHLVLAFEAGEGHFGNRVLLMVCLLDRDKRGVAGQGEVDAGEAEQGEACQSKVHIDLE